MDRQCIHCMCFVFPCRRSLKERAHVARQSAQTKNVLKEKEKEEEEEEEEEEKEEKNRTLL